ncbi:hypothetical protein DFH09DRAFT_1283987 [Mycena vulgaris]|nr:hypothetical protein DFH09DRAFT_1283987 [Mycena vulgaris]
MLSSVSAFARSLVVYLVSLLVVPISAHRCTNSSSYPQFPRLAAVPSQPSSEHGLANSHTQIPSLLLAASLLVWGLLALGRWVGREIEGETRRRVSQIVTYVTNNETSRSTNNETKSDPRSMRRVRLSLQKLRTSQRSRFGQGKPIGDEFFFFFLQGDLAKFGTDRYPPPADWCPGLSITHVPAAHLAAISAISDIERRINSASISSVAVQISLASLHDLASPGLHSGDSDFADSR